MLARPSLRPLPPLAASALAATALAATALLACGAPSALYEVETRPAAPALRKAIANACPDWRWIGILRDDTAACPELPGWEVRPLFDSAAPPPPREEDGTGYARQQPPTGPRKPDIPAGLRGFCLYEHPGAGGVLRVKHLPGLAVVERDCMTVLPQADALSGRALPQLEPYFLQQAGAFAAPPPPPGGVPAARLALLDTAPTAENPAADPDNNSLHGYTLANMARRLACNAGGGCVSEVAARLALPWVTFDPRSRALSLRDEDNGGFFGFVGELAEAVRAEVAAWQAAGAAPPLVLNLSVGWNPLFGGLEPAVEDMPVRVQAVHAALTDALCRGVPAVAAAGNLVYGPNRVPNLGPVLPAAWERRAAPTVAECNAALDPDVPAAVGPPAADAYRPLVFAVGSVEADGRPLDNARLRAEPRLVAFGDHGVVTGEGDGAATATLTGSSVGTLVVSTALSYVRAFRKDLDAFAAAAAVYESGVEPGGGRRAEVCLGTAAGPCPPGDPGGPHREVRRIFVRKAACEACTGPDCPLPCTAFSPPPADPPDLGGDAFEGFAQAPRVPLSRLRVADPRADDACPPRPIASDLRTRRRRGAEPERYHRTGGTAALRCPNWQRIGQNFAATTGPQPESDPCPSCGFGGGGGGGAGAGAAAGGPVVAAAFAAGPEGGGGFLCLEIDPRYRGELAFPVLRLGDQTYDLRPVWQDLRPGAQLCIEGATADPGEAAQLSFVVNDERSVTSLLLRTR